MTFVRAAALGVLPLASLFASACCSERPQIVGDYYDPNLPGPTTMARSSDGYELRNRHVRVVIDDKTGDVIHWGNADGSGDALNGRRLQASLAGVGPAAPDGYAEMRDEQTWQYLGEDAAAGVGWRKIYCLNGDELDVTYLIQNRRNERLTTTIGLLTSSDDKQSPSHDEDRVADDPRAALNLAPGPAVDPNLVETAAASPPGFRLQFRAFNVTASPQPGSSRDSPSDVMLRLARPTTRPARPFLVSDPCVLKSGERISWTMQWRRTPITGARRH